jgi:hypothetical protein
MTVQCISCRSFSLRGGAELAPFGFGHCRLTPKGAGNVSARYPRECPKFSAADPETERKRREWLEDAQRKAK